MSKTIFVLCEECLLPIEPGQDTREPYIEDLGYKGTGTLRHELCFWMMADKKGWLKREI